MNKPTKIVVHHTAASAPIPQFEAINEWHRVRDFPKSRLNFFIGYHYVIEKDGTVKQAREDDEIGAHTIGHNTTSLGVALVGHFSNEMPTDQQIESLGRLLDSLTKKHAIHPLNIMEHKALSSTACPGGKLHITWPVLVYLTRNETSLLNKVKAILPSWKKEDSSTNS